MSKFAFGPGAKRRWQEDMPALGDLDVLWVFGYGSLIWNPGFCFTAGALATLCGYHRSLCIWAVHYRGTPEYPGLVFGLDQGGECHGKAYAVPLDRRNEVLDYLWDREMIEDVYQPALLPCEIHGQPSQALTFIANPDHPRYAGKLSAPRIAEVVHQAAGLCGANREYVEETWQALGHLGLPDVYLGEIMAQIQSENI